MSSFAPASTNNSTGSTNAMRKKAHTMLSDKYDLDVYVSKFTSHDSDMGSMIGRGSKEVVWNIMYDRDTDPLEIRMNVQDHKLHYHECGVVCTTKGEKQHVLAGAGSDLAKMKQDFSHDWPFRCNIFGMNEVNFFEMRPAHLPSDVWYPATIKKQHAAGGFEVDAMEPDVSGAGGFRRVHYPIVDIKNLREASSHEPLNVPRASLRLFVPMKDPMNATLTLENGSPITHSFGRLSPPKDAERKKICFTVAKDRSTVTADAGHAELHHFMSGQVRTVKNDVQRLSRSWAFQLGPLAQHTVELSKRHKAGSVITLSVDNEVFVEALAAEIGCKGADWECSFQFFGERTLEFDVYKTNKEGTPTDNKGTVKERRRYVHTCRVVVPKTLDFTTAQLFIDGKQFYEHEVAPPKHQEPNVEMTPHTMLSTYNIVVPYQVDPDAASNLTILTNKVTDAAQNFSLFSMWSMCCGQHTLKESSKHKIDLKESNIHEFVESETVLNF